MADHNPLKYISINNVNEDFNVEIQPDFGFSVIQNIQRTILFVTDTGTGYREGSIVQRRDFKTIISTLETIWIYNHGSPQYISADDEYNLTSFHKFMRTHSIVFKSRPTRLQNMNGIVERKIGVIKTIIEKLTVEVTSSLPNKYYHDHAFYQTCVQARVY